MDKPVCVVVGVGEGNGAALARRFSDDGYATALLARGLDYTTALAAELPDSKAYACDVGEARAVGEAFAAIRHDLGEPAVLAYNAGSGVWGSAEEISPAQFEAAWRVNALGLLLCAQQVTPAMKAKGAGAIVVTGATASRRGGIKTAAFAPAKAAQRSLCESLARRLWPAGIHVAVIIVDGVVDLPRTRAAMPDKPASFFVQPDDVAANAAWLVAQPRSAWSFEIEARPFGETW
ncbi:SDR family NAD(P)-dependent oxidoreductase [Caulobacter sp. 17J65-9]|uniref:SDR family NAD(P)-dependent oxidoreductase n=1 Tax=Caulobacter sp. 17J65-9 TaxID=2709382 RepID=UPI0013C7D898|nr:SDR family NAD(P)-dependent oxidoreductase [Caulobacter sp. 17J65-9]NEX93189.1 SDR family NAD(P)-dependent oxidoreductase [Caulobacter sp. 17J65-9]